MVCRLILHWLFWLSPASPLAAQDILAMRNWFDHYTKSFLQDMLGPTGKVETQHEIAAADSQWADVWYEPNPAQAHLRDRMGWLGVMSAAPCMFEPFGQPPDEEEVRECQRKLFTKQHLRVREAKKKQAARPVLPRQWIIAPSLPPRFTGTFGLQPVNGFPQGIHVGLDGYGLGWVSLRDLPRTRQTLLLRLMSGAGPVFRSALEDLKNLPGDAWENEAAEEMLVARCDEMAQAGAGSEEEQDFLMSTKEVYQRWECRVRGEGRTEARQEMGEGLRSGLLETYRARFGAVPPVVESAVQHVHDPDKLTRWFPLFSTKSAEDIADVLRVAGSGSR
jgi:hypothetical protein